MVKSKIGMFDWKLLEKSYWKSLQFFQNFLKLQNYENKFFHVGFLFFMGNNPNHYPWTCIDLAQKLKSISIDQVVCLFCDEHTQLNQQIPANWYVMLISLLNKHMNILVSVSKANIPLICYFNIVATIFL